MRRASFRAVSGGGHQLKLAASPLTYPDPAITRACGLVATNPHADPAKNNEAGVRSLAASDPSPRLSSRRAA
jgi:hypothetical protein